MDSITQKGGSEMAKRFLAIILVLILSFASTYDIATSSADEDVELGFESIDFDNIDIEKIIEENNKVELTDEEIKTLKYIRENFRINSSNTDLKGWLFLKDYIDEPIMDTPYKMQKYLRLNIKQKWYISGCPFMSATSESTFNGNSLVYGHNMNNGTSFGKLRHLRTSGISELPLLYVYDGFTDTFRIYRIFSLFHVIDGKEFVQLKHFLNSYSKISNDSMIFDTKESYEKYKNEVAVYNESIKDRSIFPTDWNIDYNADTLFLQHCTGEGNKTKRDVLAFSMIKHCKFENEDAAGSPASEADDEFKITKVREPELIISSDKSDK